MPSGTLPRPDRSALPDHRPRVAAARRERARNRLLASAFAIAAGDGPAAVAIDAVVAGAGLSRASFYKYFDSTGALQSQLAAELASDLIGLADPLVRVRQDPAEQLAIGMRCVLGLVRRHPVLGGFVARGGWPLLAPEHDFFGVVAPDILRGLRSGRFTALHREAALSLVAGVGVGAAHALSTRPLPADFEAQAIACVLRGLGLSADEASRLACLDVAVPEPAAGSLLARLLSIGPGPAGAQRMNSDVNPIGMHGPHAGMVRGS